MNTKRTTAKPGNNAGNDSGNNSGKPRSYRALIILGYAVLLLLLIFSATGAALIWQQLGNARSGELRLLMQWHGYLYIPFVIATLFFYWRCSRIATPWYHGVTWFILIGCLVTPAVQSALFHTFNFRQASFDEVLIGGLHYLFFPLMLLGLISVEVVRLKRRSTWRRYS